VNPLFVAASQGRKKYNLKAYKDKIRFQLGFTATRAFDVITGASVTISHPNNIKLDTTKVFGGEVASLKFDGTDGSSATLPSNASYLPRTGDFTFEAVFDFSTIKPQPVDGSMVVPLFSWQTWAATGQPNNLDVMYFFSNGNPWIRFANSSGMDYSYPLSAALSVNTQHHIVIERKAGIVSTYVNGTRVRTLERTNDITLVTTQPIRLGSRRGGGSGNVYWQLVGSLLGLRITHAAIYDAASYPVPTSFK
jgi:hypothetical protein